MATVDARKFEVILCLAGGDVVSAFDREKESESRVTVSVATIRICLFLFPLPLLAR